jgi:hypothetical protein
VDIGVSIVVPQDGVYFFAFRIAWEPTGTSGYRIGGVHLNTGAGPVEITGWRAQMNIGAAESDNVIGSSMSRRFAKGNVLTVRVFQNSGVALNFNGAASLTRIPG